MISKEKKQAIIKEYARTEGDTGSPEVQVAVLTARIESCPDQVDHPLVIPFQVQIPHHGLKPWGLRPMLATESEPPMSFNISYYENEKVDQLLKDGLATADEDKRGEIYGEVQDIVWKDLPLLCIASDKNIWATSNNITGVYLLGDGSIGMRNARMAAE